MSAAEQLQASAERLLLVAAASLRDAVEVFNASPVSLSSVDAFREHVLHVADHLAAPLPDVKPAAPLSRALAEVHAIGESRRVD